jgi:hypothetical protein
MALDADLLALRTPTRSNGLARPEVLPPGAEVWLEVRAHVDFSRWNRESLERRFDPAIIARLVDLQSTDAPPEDAAVLGVLGRLVRRGVDRLALAVGGVEGALRYMLAFAKSAPQPYFSFLPPLSEATRSATLTLPDDAHEAALRVARDLVAGAPVEAALAIADCFPDDQHLIETAAQAAMASSLTPLPARIFGALRKPELVARAIERRPKNSLVALLPVAVDLVVNLGPEAAQPLAAILAARSSDGAPEVLVAARALASLDTEGAGRALVLFLDSKVLAPVAEAWCKRVGDAARAPLHALLRGEIFAKKASGKRALVAAKALLGEEGAKSLESAAAPIVGLPAVLAAPPWLARSKSKEKALHLETATAPEDIPTRREVRRHPSTREGEHEKLEAARSGKSQIYVSSLGALPDAEALAFWNEADAAWFHGGDYDGREVSTLLDRFGLDALPGLLRYAEGKLPSAEPALVRVVSPRVAPYIALIFAKGKKRARSEAWLLAHPEAAALGLVPAALGADRAKREAARTALRYLVACDFRDVVRDAAARYGAAAEQALGVALQSDLPARIPDGPSLADAGELPQIRLSNGATVPPEAAAHLVTMLRFSPVVPAYSGLAEVRAACDRASLSAFVTALFERWKERGCAPGDEWALWAMGHLGDDEAAKRIVASLGSWQTGGAAQRAARGLDAIALIGSDWAFFELDRIARSARYPLLRDAAEAAVARVAGRLHIHPDELEDRRAPTLGLDARGELAIAFEKGELVATFDEHLVPFLRDAQGERVAKVPKSGAGPAAFKALVKSAALVAESQIARLERALITQRPWTMDAFCTHIVGHPLLLHLARRLVWSVDGATFRVAEDRSFADLDDAAFTLPSGAASRVRIAHPAHLSENDRLRWSERFSDYRILQPFPQLGRRVLALDPGDREGTRLASLEGTRVPWHSVAKLLRQGFRDASADSVLHSLSLRLPFGPTLSLSLNPGLSRADVSHSGEQTLASVRVHGLARLADLDAVAQSELLLTLAPLTEPD